MRARMGVLVATFALFVMIFLRIPLTHAQSPEFENFSVSPADFTMKNVPPLGEPYLIEQKLRIRNGAHIERNFVLSVHPPLENELTEGFDAIPNENWVILMPAAIPIEANSDNLVNVVLDMPRWENLTNQLWEARISVERQPMPGEIVALTLEIKAYIETTKELPPPPPPRSPLPFTMIIIMVVGVVGVALLFGILARRRRGGKEFDIVTSSAYLRNSSPWLK